jgi:two-component system sensor histidine kinase QseC
MIKRSSIKRKLIFTLCAVLFPALVITYGVSFLSAKSEVQKVFDAHLVKSAKLIFGLIRHEVDRKKNLNFLSDFNYSVQQKSFDSNERKIHFQAWKNNKMIYSSDKKNSSKPDYEGFRDEFFQGNKWHSFSFYDAESGIRVLVSERDVFRQELIFQILLFLFVPLLISFAPLFLLITTTINRSINPLHRLAFKMKKMSATTLEPFTRKKIPLELQPFIDSFNSLLARLRSTLESEQRFTDYAAHELRTPLAAIKIQAQLLAANQDKSRDKEYLSDLLEGVDRASHMVNQLLTLARVQPEIQTENFLQEKINLGDLIKTILQNFTAGLAKKNLAVKFERIEQGVDDFTILANKNYLEILLNNLIDNAIKYGYENSEIDINLSSKESTIKLVITNQGDALSQEDIHKIFDNFYRVDKSEMTRNASGSGLGLAIAKKIAELYKGKIFFSSSVDGKNSVTVLIAKHSDSIN